MIRDCDDRILKKFDCHQDYLWLNNHVKDRYRGILVGVRTEFYDVGAFHQGEFMFQLDLWDKINKSKWNLLVVYGAPMKSKN